MSSTPQHGTDHTLAYPEPPASPLWHRHPKAPPLTPAQRKRNYDLLLDGARRTPCTTAAWARAADYQVADRLPSQAVLTAYDAAQQYAKTQEEAG
ncbi:hypothetical protein [Streptomyces sp. Ac-502]|uniref:hypothetical protein n=1 Tax=Streptomyces sp. Ac-502 TaxID=3342801 RepID=UPI003862BF5C